MNTPLKRNHAFDFLCGICIIRMISLHVLNICGQGDAGWWEEVMQWTYFFMSFFFFKAGYFNKGVMRPTGEYLKDRFKRLFIPYVAWGTIGNAIYFAFLPKLMERYHKPIEPLAWDHVWRTSSFYGNSPTWFLFSFFMAYVAVHFIEKARRRLPLLSPALLLLPVASILLSEAGNPLWLSLNNVFMGVYFFYLGRVWRWIQEHNTARGVSQRFSAQFFLSLILVLGFIAGNLLWGGRYTMSNNTYQGTPWLVVITCSMALCGIAGLLLELRLPRIPLINYIGEHSMVYFVCHYPMLYIYKFTHLCFGRSIYERWDDAVLLLPIVLCICSWLVPYIERVPWLSGRWSQTPQPIGNSNLA